MRKSFEKLFVMLVFAITMMIGVTANASATSYQNSGRSSISKLSWGQLAYLYDNIPTYTNLYSVNPSVSANNYSISTLTTEAANNGLGLINYYRLVSGLSKVSFSSDLNTSAAYGALVLAGYGTLSHTPSQPSGMAKEIYDLGYAATSSSNISSCAGSNTSQVLLTAVKGQMEDTSTSNLATLGHRRWLLNPSTVNMGLGVANNSSKYFTDIRVMGNGTQGTTVSDYDFISWPASGNNLSDTFHTNNPWSITLNPARYSTSNLSNVTVTLTQVSTGTTWVFNSATGTTNSKTANYFNVNTNGYGVKNCIIFRPAYGSMDSYNGDYTVSVSGITTSNGAAATINYKVSFASRSSIKETEAITNLQSVIGQDANPAANDTSAVTTTTTTTTTTTRNTVSSQNGSTTATQTVANPTVSLKSAKSNKKKTILVKWNMDSSCDGCQIQYSTTVNFKANTKTTTLIGKMASAQIKKLKSKKAYYVRVRSINRNAGDTLYSNWSGTKKIKVK